MTAAAVVAVGSVAGWAALLACVAAFVLGGVELTRSRCGPVHPVIVKVFRAGLIGAAGLPLVAAVAPAGWIYITAAVAAVPGAAAVLVAAREHRRGRPVARVIAGAAAGRVGIGDGR